MPLWFASRVIREILAGMIILVFREIAVTRRRTCMAMLSMNGRIILTVTGMRRRHGQAAGRPGSKEAALAGARCLNPHPEQVTDAEFGQRFFDVQDGVQVKYEMVRRSGRGARYRGGSGVRLLPAGVAAVAAMEFGLEGAAGTAGLRGAHKLTEQIIDWDEEQLNATRAALGAAAGPDRGGLRRARAAPVGGGIDGPPPGAAL